MQRKHSQHNGTVHRQTFSVKVWRGLGAPPWLAQEEYKDRSIAWGNHVQGRQHPGPHEGGAVLRRPVSCT